MKYPLFSVFLTFSLAIACFQGTAQSPFPNTHIIHREEFTDLLPCDLKTGKNQTPAVWDRFDERTIDYLIQQIENEEVQFVEDQQHNLFPRIAFSSPFEKALYTGEFKGEKTYGTEELPKAQILAQSYEKWIGSNLALSASERQTIQKVILYAHDFFNFTNQNSRRILRQDKQIKAIIREHAGIWEASFEPFFKEVGEKMRAYLAQFEEKEKEVVCLYSTSGGAHLMINNNLQADYQKLRAKGPQLPPLQSVNETAAWEEEDVLFRFTGFSAAEIHNIVYTRAGNHDYAAKLKRLHELLNLFVPCSKVKSLRRKTHLAPLLVNVSHHPDAVRLLVDEDRQNLIFQVCDYGEISSSLSPLMQKIIRYDLENIFFHLPSNDLSLTMEDEGGKLLRLSREAKEFRKITSVGPYPVHENFTREFSNEEVIETRQTFGFAPDSHIYILQMGTQGVGFLLEQSLEQLFTGLLQDPDPTELDVLVICGYNESLRDHLREFSQRKIEELAAQFPEFSDKVKNNLHLHFFGFVPNDQMGKLSHLVTMCVSKPGGGYTGEATAAAIPTAIYLTKDLWWEENNIPQLKKVGGVVIEKGKSIYEIGKRFQGRPRQRSEEVFDGTLVTYLLEQY